MLGSIYIGLSGLGAYSKGLQSISNNVANLNSPGFKASTVSFVDIFNYGGLGSSFTGGAGAQQIGGGVRYEGGRIDFRQGDLRQSANDLDLAIQGNGFLVLLKEEGAGRYYARTGQFAVDDDGYVAEVQTGHRLAVLDKEGRPVALNLASHGTYPPVATTRIRFADNLSSSGDGTTIPDLEVFDSLGARHDWKVEIARHDPPVPDQWKVRVLDENGVELKVATLKFVQGQIDASTSRFTVLATPQGAQPLSVELDFSSGVTSFSSGTLNMLRAESVDGSGTGTSPVVTIDEEGRVKLTYSNRETKSLGAVALADFRNPQHLQRVGNALFESRAEGPDRLLASGAEGAGRLLSRQLEASNVDLSQQFGDLILIQRGFQASSQVVSVSNDMIQQLFGIRGQS